MRARILRLAVLWLVAGLVSSVLVAWGATAWSEREAWAVRDLGPWLWAPPAGAEREALVSSRRGWAVVEREATGTVEERGEDGRSVWRTHGQYELRAGWPWVALRRVVEGDSGATPIYEKRPRGLRAGLSVGPLRELLGIPEGRHLPVAPALGLAGDVAVHGAVWVVCWLCVRWLLGPIVGCMWSRRAREAVFAVWEGSFAGGRRPRIGEGIALAALLAGGRRASWRPRWTTVVALAVFGLAGAVGSAWVCAVVVVPRAVNRTNEDRWARQNEKQSQGRWIDGRAFNRVRTGFGIDVYIEILGQGNDPDTERVEAGWPRRSMTRFREARWSSRTRPAVEGTPWMSGFVLRPPSGVGKTLLEREWRVPLRPIWTGLIVNVLLWGLVAAVLTVPLGVVRSARRLCGHRCPWCGYPIATGPVCTECGSRFAESGKSAKQQSSK